MPIRGAVSQIYAIHIAGVSQGPLPVINVVINVYIEYIYHPPKFNLAPEELLGPNRKVLFPTNIFQGRAVKPCGCNSNSGFATFGEVLAKSPSQGLKSPSGGLRGT